MNQLRDAEKHVVTRLRMYAPWLSRQNLESYLVDCRQEGEGRIVALAKGEIKILVAKPGDVSKHFADAVIAERMLGSDVRTVGANVGIGSHRKYNLEDVKK